MTTYIILVLFYILQKDLEQADRMRNTGENLIMDDNYAVDSIRPKCIELQRMCEQYRQLVRQRREILQKSGDLQERIDMVRKLMFYYRENEIYFKLR